MKKCFVLTQFGKPHEWTTQYFENIRKLGEYDWYWKIFTPNVYENIPSNVEIVPMTIEQHNMLVKKTCGVNPKNYLENGFPHKPVSDFYVATGVIYKKWLKEFDFWGMANWDIVYGRLDHFISDETLEDCDIFTDDINTINGIFALFRNIPEVNNLFKEIPNWEHQFTDHHLYGTDEYGLTDVMRRDDIRSKIRYCYPTYYPMHSHDRLEQHVPEVKLEIKKNGSLWEFFRDVNHPNWAHARPFIGREIPYLHFIRTKAWPKCLL